MNVDDESGAVHLALEANTEGWIRDRTYEGRLILGPAIIYPHQSVVLAENAFIHPGKESVDEDDIGEWFLVVPEGTRLVGVIGLDRVTFRNCRMMGVGIACTGTSYPELLAGFTHAEG